jgi:uncharacterized MAPEG superfamily protein
MIVAYWCVLLAGILPLICSYVAKFGGGRGPDVEGYPARFDNHEPRAWLARQTGRRARANAAQANSFEAFPFFAVGVVIAVAQHVPIMPIDVLAVVFIVARVLYIACYIGDMPRLRSPLFSVGFAASVGLYAYAATGTLR